MKVNLEIKLVLNEDIFTYFKDVQSLNIESAFKTLDVSKASLNFTDTNFSHSLKKFLKVDNAFLMEILISINPVFWN